jgi:hypothetical protein
MATFTFSLSGSTIVNGSKSWTVPDSDVQVLINFQTKKHAGDDDLAAPLTPAQALLAWVQGLIDGTVAEIHASQLRKAHQAVTPPPPLSFT